MIKLLESFLMNYALFTVYFIVALVGMEIISYLVHRFLFHGLLWNIHISHHTSTRGFFEDNDLFSLFFAIVSIILIWTGSESPLNSASFPVGLGIAFYGVLYFIVHDIITHKRFISIKSDNTLIQLIKKAHQRHHQTIQKDGQEPYGLFLFPYNRYKSDKRND